MLLNEEFSVLEKYKIYKSGALMLTNFILYVYYRD